MNCVNETLAVLTGLRNAAQKRIDGINALGAGTPDYERGYRSCAFAMIDEINLRILRYETNQMIKKVSQ